MRRIASFGVLFVGTSVTFLNDFVRLWALGQLLPRFRTYICMDMLRLPNAVLSILWLCVVKK